MTLAQLFLAVTVALLCILIVGAVVGLMAWPMLAFAYRNANRALGLVSLAVNTASGLLAFVLLRAAGNRSRHVASAALFQRNAWLFSAASVVVVILLLEQILAFTAGEIRTLSILYFTPSTAFTPSSALWGVGTNIVLPGVVLYLLLWGSARKHASSSGGA